jgi:hypothetical protein
MYGRCGTFCPFLLHISCKRDETSVHEIQTPGNKPKERIQKFTFSIPDGVTAIFHSHNPSGRTMALELTQPLTEMSTRNFSWGVKAAGA